MIRGYCIGGGLGLAIVLRPAHLLGQFAVCGSGGEARSGLRLCRPQAPRRYRRAVLWPRRFSTPRASSTRRKLTPWVSSTAWCRRPSSKAAVKDITDMICANAPLTIKAVKFAVGEILKDESRAQHRARRRDGGGLLQEPRLHRRPHRLHGEAQAGVYRHVTAMSVWSRAVTLKRRDEMPRPMSGRARPNFYFWIPVGDCAAVDRHLPAGAADAAPSARRR